MKKIELTNEEMSFLVGGSTVNMDSLAPQDILNLNKVDGCTCLFNNFSTITNDNQIAGCRCKCVVN